MNKLTQPDSFNFKIQTNCPKTSARTGIFTTPHGEIQTPIFMPVGTLGSIKSLSNNELYSINAQIILANNYHLFLRPGSKTIKQLGGIHNWMSWQKPILTDSGGFQVFSLAGNKSQKNSYVKITDSGIYFKSHLDGTKHFFTPKSVIESQQNIGADIIMPLDECAPGKSSHQYAKEALNRTHLWLQQAYNDHKFLESQKQTEKPQTLFPIIQGVTYADLRIESAKYCTQFADHGIAIGGLSVGEPRQTMYRILEILNPHLPQNKPRYLMGVGTPRDLFEGVERGIDMFDCVHPTRISRHGCFYNESGRHQIKSEQFKLSQKPLSEQCSCYACKTYSLNYIRHLYREGEILAHRLLTLHNLSFILNLMQQIRHSINQNRFTSFKSEFFNQFKAEN